MTDLGAAAQQFGILARHLRDAGEGGLKRQLYDAISAAVLPALAEIRADLPRHMPGRYAGVLGADLKLETRRALGYDAGVRVAGSATTRSGGRRKVRRVEAGILAHPLFGDRKKWFEQTDGMTPKFFSGPLEAAAPEIRDAILAAMHDVAVEITRKT